MPEGNFEFRDFEEEPDELDYQKLRPCPWCKKSIPQDANLCYYCGRPTTSFAQSFWLVWVAVIVIIVFVVFLLASR